MKVLMIGWTPPKEGGSEQHILELSSRVNSTVLTQRGSLCKDKIEINVPRKPTWLANLSFFFYCLIYSIYLVASRKKYDLVHIHENILYFLVPILRIKYPVVVTIHGINGFKFYDHKFLWQIFKTPLLQASLIIAVNKADKSELEKYFKKVAYMPNGVNVGLYAKARARQENKISFIGRIHEQKGLVYLLEAFSLLSKKDSSLHLEIIGSNNEYAKELKKRFPSNKIVWQGYIGNRKKQAEHLKSARVIVLPSLWEGLPLTLFEALATGRPVVVSDIPAFRSVLTDKEVLFAKVKNPQDLSTKIASLLSNKKKSDSIAFHGQKKAGLYDWDKIAQDLERVYSDLK